MKNDIFHITARLTADGTPIPSLLVTILDWDPIRDDLLGLGLTDSDGRIHISFTTKEFNQDPFEREATPDIYLVCSVRANGNLVVCFQHDHPGPVHLGHNDLGDIPIFSWTDAPNLKPHATPIPGLRNIARLDIDDALIHHAIQDVAPHVERLTCWPDLLDDLEFGNMSDYADEILTMLEARESAGWLERKLARTLFDGVALNGAYAVYSPWSHTIFLNERSLERCNLDGFKVILGHELVHVGQFKYHPRLKADHQQVFAMLCEHLSGDDVPNREAIKKTLADPALTAHMLLIEGYATYIHTCYLERIYTHAMIMPHVSWFERLVLAGFRRTIPELDQVLEAKMAQYSDGLRQFTAEPAGDTPQPFTY